MRALIVALAFALLGPAGALAQADPMLDGDPTDGSGALIELQPAVPLIEAGGDGEFGTGDDVVSTTVFGDVDLVVRAGITSFSGAIPAPAPLRGAIPVAVAEVADATPIPFVVVVSDGDDPPAAGNPVTSAAVEGNPVLVVAFADLDGDGFVGVTDLDGDPGDAATEEVELNEVGRRFAFFSGGRAAGELHIEAGAPPGTTLSLVLTAAAYTGDFDPGFFGGEVPEGPAVFAAFPTFPRTDPDDAIEGNLPNPADVNGRVGVEVSDEFTPDPSAAYGEVFTLPTDGSRVSIDVAEARSGTQVDYALGRSVDPSSYDEGSSGPLRRGLDEGGAPLLLEMLRNPVPAGALRVVPTDRLGNVSAAGAAARVLVLAQSGAAIASPDADGDPSREELVIAGPEGRALTLSNPGALVVELVPEANPAWIGAAALLSLFALALRRGAVA